MEKKERTELPMVCVCDDEGMTEARELRREVEQKLEIVGHYNFTSSVIASLWWDFNATVEGIYMDMWFGVKVSTEDRKGETLWVQCDRVEDGLAAIWKHLADKRDESGV